MSGYDRLAPFIREYIWQNRWQALRDVQETAIDAILGGEGHVLIAAGTASGKTEAAFFPILTRMTEQPVDGFGALYVGPLKALINDQFERLWDLLDEADIPVYAWHGDRPESEKGRAERAPRGVLQITPEALEGLLMHKAGLAARMLGGLQFIVIDELHAFMGTDRGLQLQCQLARIDRLAGRCVRRVGLSATIADYEAARAWLSAGTTLDSIVVESRAGGRRLDIALQHYVPVGTGMRRDGDAPSEAPAELSDTCAEDAARAAEGIIPDASDTPDTQTGNVQDSVEASAGTDPSAGASEAEAEKGDSPDGPEPLEGDDAAPEPPLRTEAELPADLYRMVRGRRALVFTNSRAETETIVAALRAEAEKAGEPDVFHAHHGSLSAAIRHDAEDAMKAAEGAAVAVATRTLELGIDLGKLDRVVQLGAADSCSGFVQRLGRTGRRGQNAVMRFLTRSRKQGKSAFDDLPWELIRSVAVIQLFLEERWVEPFEDKPLPYSLLFQQIISALMPGELTPRALAKAVHTLPAFRQISVDDYIALIHHMLDSDMLTRMETGTLLPGLAGEKLAADYRFLSVFADGGGCRVVCNGQEIGSIDRLPAVGETFSMAGRAWRVTEVEGRSTVYVVPASGHAEAGWQSGGADVHDHIVEKQREILLGDASYPYLRPAAAHALETARRQAGDYALAHLLTPVGLGTLLIHPWLGTRKLETLSWLLRGPWSNRLAIQTVRTEGNGCALRVGTLLPRKMFLKQLRSCLVSLEPQALEPMAPAEPLDRNDAFLPPELLKKAYVYNHLDISGLRDALLMHPDIVALETDEETERAEGQDETLTDAAPDDRVGEDTPDVRHGNVAPGAE